MICVLFGTGKPVRQVPASKSVVSGTPEKLRIFCISVFIILHLINIGKVIEELREYQKYNEMFLCKSTVDWFRTEMGQRGQYGQLLRSGCIVVLGPDLINCFCLWCK